MIYKKIGKAVEMHDGVYQQVYVVAEITNKGHVWRKFEVVGKYWQKVG